MPKFLIDLVNLAGLLNKPEVLSFEDSLKIKQQFIIDEKFFLGKRGLRKQALKENPEEINHFIQKLVSYLKDKTIYIEFSQYEVGLIQINDSHILTKWQSMINFDGNTIWMFSPETHHCLCIDLAEDWLVEMKLDNGRHWIYDISMSGVFDYSEI